MFAVFFEAQPIASGKPQWLIFPTNGSSYAIYHRVSDGGKGGTNRWRIVQHIIPDLPLSSEPTVVVVTDSDRQQFSDSGMPTTLTSKALKAHLTAGETDLTTSDMNAVVTEVASRDSSLNRWLRDGRRVRPVATSNVKVSAPSFHSVKEVSVSDEVSSFVPDKKKYEGYVHRDIDGRQDFEYFDWARRNHHNVLLEGPTGAAKTTSVLAYAAANNLPVAMISGSMALEPSHFIGSMTVDEHQNLRWQDGVVTEVVRTGGIILLDEIGMINQKIITPLFPLLQYGTRHLVLLEHRGEKVQAHPDLLIVGTMNPATYAGNSDLSFALRNRFTIQLEWGYDDRVEKALVRSKTLREIATKIRGRESREEIITPTPTNALMEFEVIARDLSLKFAINNFVNRYTNEEGDVVRMIINAEEANLRSELLGDDAPIVETDEEIVDLSSLGDIDLADILN
jgi:MoxR-like ATPase